MGTSERTGAEATSSEEPGSSAAMAGRRGGIKRGGNRALPADATERRKAALHALRFAFQADVHVDDAASPDAMPASAGAVTDA